MKYLINNVLDNINNGLDGITFEMSDRLTRKEFLKAKYIDYIYLRLIQKYFNNNNQKFYGE